MQTAARSTLVLTGTAILVAAMATAGARADRSKVDGYVAIAGAITAPQRPEQQPRPDRLRYFLASEFVSTATAIARLPPAPEVASLKRGDERMEGQEVAKLAVKKDRTKNRSIAGLLDDFGDAPAVQQAASDGGRQALIEPALYAVSERAACLGGRELERQRRTRQIMESEEPQRRRRDPAPVVIRFEGAINISLAGLGW